MPAEPHRSVNNADQPNIMEREAVTRMEHAWFGWQFGVQGLRVLGIVNGRRFRG